MVMRNVSSSHQKPVPKWIVRVQQQRRMTRNVRAPTDFRNDGVELPDAHVVDPFDTECGAQDTLNDNLLSGLQLSARGEQRRPRAHAGARWTAVHLALGEHADVARVVFAARSGTRENSTVEKSEVLFFPGSPVFAKRSRIRCRMRSRMRNRVRLRYRPLDLHADLRQLPRVWWREFESQHVGIDKGVVRAAISDVVPYAAESRNVHLGVERYGPRRHIPEPDAGYAPAGQGRGGRHEPGRRIYPNLHITIGTVCGAPEPADEARSLGRTVGNGLRCARQRCPRQNGFQHDPRHAQNAVAAHG